MKSESGVHVVAFTKLITVSKIIIMLHFRIWPLHGTATHANDIFVRVGDHSSTHGFELASFLMEIIFIMVA